MTDDALTCSTSQRRDKLRLESQAVDHLTALNSSSSSRQRAARANCESISFAEFPQDSRKEMPRRSSSSCIARYFGHACR